MRKEEEEESWKKVFLFQFVSVVGSFVRRFRRSKTRNKRQNKNKRKLYDDDDDRSMIDDEQFLSGVLEAEDFGEAGLVDAADDEILVGLGLGLAERLEAATRRQRLLLQSQRVLLERDVLVDASQLLLQNVPRVPILVKVEKNIRRRSLRRQRALSLCLSYLACLHFSWRAFCDASICLTSSMRPYSTSSRTKSTPGL